MTTNQKETIGNNSSKVQSYLVNGLYLECTLPCHQLALSHHIPDVRIQLGKVPEQLEQASYIGASFQAKQGEYLQIVANVARYLVKNGNEVTIEPSPGAKEEEIIYFLLNAPIGVLAQQRGHLVIQASAVEVNGKAVLFAGPSASGKSTFAFLLQQNNYKVIADDICTIVFDEKGMPFLQRGYAHLNLWADTLNKVKFSTSSYQVVREGLKKYRVPFLQISQKQLPVQSLHTLWGTKNTSYAIEPLSGLKKIIAINNSIWRKQLMYQIGSKQQNFEKLEQLSEFIKVAQLERQYQPFNSSKIVDMLQKDFSI